MSVKVILTISTLWIGLCCITVCDGAEAPKRRVKLPIKGAVASKHAARGLSDRLSTAAIITRVPQRSPLAGSISGKGLLGVQDSRNLVSGITASNSLDQPLSPVGQAPMTRARESTSTPVPTRIGPSAQSNAMQTLSISTNASHDRVVPRTPVPQSQKNLKAR